jgi:uncharacterized membrane protein YhhN
MNWIQILLLVVFGVDVSIHLLGEYLIKKGKAGDLIEYLTKPFLMPLLAAFYVASALDTSTPINWWFVAGILGGFLGDFFLMLPDKSGKNTSFKIGLIAFLLGHIFYIISMITRGWDYGGFRMWSLGLGTLFVVYGIILAPKLLKHTGKMSIPVGVYIVVIVLMGYSTSVLIGIVNLSAVILLIVGAWLFIISDTLNAWHRFVSPIIYERLWVMSTYIAGQFLIVFGFVLAI